VKLKTRKKKEKEEKREKTLEEKKEKQKQREAQAENYDLNELKRIEYEFPELNDNSSVGVGSSS
jgi:hypothetical protein